MYTATGLLVHRILKNVARNDQERLAVLKIAARVTLESDLDADLDADLVHDIAALVRRNSTVPVATKA